jgi:hypothetical protein
MENRERLHRPELGRTEPIRNVATYLGNPVSGAGASSTPEQHGPAETADGAVARGVRLGYSVIEEQLREGQRLAQRLGRAAGKATASGSDEIGPLIERALNLYKDMGALCFEAIETLARSPVLSAGFSRMWQAKAETEPGPDITYGLELASKRRTQVTLNLRRFPGHFIPLVHTLHASDPAIPPLTGVRFKMEAASQTPILQVEIPDTQAPATYTGVVADSTTNEPCGTICLRILP